MANAINKTAKTAAKASANTAAKVRAGIGHNSKGPFVADLKAFEVALTATSKAGADSVAKAKETATGQIEALLADWATKPGFAFMTADTYQAKIDPILTRVLDAAVVASVASFKTGAKALFLCASHGVTVTFTDAEPKGIVKRSPKRNAALRTAGVIPALAGSGQRGRKAKATEGKGVLAKSQGLETGQKVGAPGPKFTPTPPVVATRTDLLAAGALLFGLADDSVTLGKVIDVVLANRAMVLAYFTSFDGAAAKQAKGVKGGAPKV